MSSKAGYLKSYKKLSNNIGSTLQNIGNEGYKFFNTGIVETGMEAVGRTVGSAAIPIVGGTIGKNIGENLAHQLKYGFGLVGEIGKSIQDINNGSSVFKEIGDVLSYVPKQVAKDAWNSELVKVVTGRTTVPDAIMKGLEDYSGVGLLSDKTYAWKNNNGEYSKTWSREFSKPVVGKWHTQQSSIPRPDISSNAGIMGVGKNGEILLKGFN